MLLILVRHGRAEPAGADEERPLTPEGRADAQRAAAFVARLAGADAEVYHSGLRRAAQTAEIVAAALRAAPPRIAKGLHPDDDPDDLDEFLRETPRDAVLVGHLPHLARLIRRLLHGGPALGADVPPGTVACLSRLDGPVPDPREPPRFALRAFVPPYLSA